MAKAAKNARSAAALVAGALNVAVAEVPPDARMGAFEAWDSLGHLRIMLALEDALGRRLDATEAIRIESVADIADALNE